MPVVTISALESDAGDRVPQMLAAVVRDLSAALRMDSAHVWANFTPMTAVHEGSIPGGHDYHIVVIVRGNPRPEALVAQALTAVAKSVAAGLNVRPERIWVQWIDLPPGRAFWNGKVV